MEPIKTLWLVGLFATSIGTQALHAKDTQLFNGKDLSGWTALDKKKPLAEGAHWKAEGEEIVGDNPDKKNSVLWTDQEFGDFELSLEFMTPSPDYDSGVFVRGPSHQVQIGISRSLKKDLTACIYAPVDGKGSYPAISDQVLEVHQGGKWNTLKIVAKGKRLQTWLNGVKFVDYEAEKIPAKGPIGLQLHAGVHQEMHFRNLVVKD